MIDLDMTETTRIANVPMQEMVFGRPAPRRFRFPSRLIFVAALAAMSVGCASSRQSPPEVESVGTLAASYHSIAVQAVHADTDLSGGFQAVEGDDDAGEVATTVSRVDAPESPDGSELPEVAPKTDGVSVGEAR